MSCTVCEHPRRLEIDQALIAGSATLAALSQEYGLSTSALHRHKAHLQAKVSRGKDQLQDNLRQGCFFWISQALEMSMQTAQAEGRSRIVLQALSQGTRLVTIVLKQDLPLDDLLVYKILSSPQWAAQDDILPHDPQVMAAGRQALLGAFSSACPEPGEVPSADLDLNALQDVLATLGQPPATAGDLKPQIPTRLSKKRDKGGKLPGKSSLNNRINEDYQLDNLKEKISGMFHPFPPADLKTASREVPADKPISEYLYEQSLREHRAADPPARYPGHGGQPGAAYS